MLSDVETWEEMVEATGGVEITIAGTPAWAHVEEVPLVTGEGPAVQQMVTTAMVHRDRLPASPKGAAVVIGAATYVITNLGDKSDDVGRELLLRENPDA